MALAHLMIDGEQKWVRKMYLTKWDAGRPQLLGG